MSGTIAYRIYLQQSLVTAWMFYLDYKPLTHITKLVHIYILKTVSLASTSSEANLPTLARMLFAAR